MEINFTFMPRQSGKTKTSIELFLRDPENTFLCVLNSMMIKDIKHQVPFEFHHNICCVGQVLSTLRGRNFTNFILDEYLFYPIDGFNRMENIYMSIMGSSSENSKIYIFTTSNKKIKKSDFNAAYTIRNYDVNPLDYDANNEDIRFLLHSFLVEPGTKIRTYRHPTLTEAQEGRFMSLGREHFELEELNNWLEE